MAENLKKLKRCINKRKIKPYCSCTVFEKILLEKSNFSQLFSYVSCYRRSNNRFNFSEIFFRESIHLVSWNLFRTLPCSSDNETAAGAIQFGESFYIKKNKTNKLNSSNSFQDPSWPHLELVYRFLLLLLQSPRTNPQKFIPYIQPSFILRLLDLFQSEDGRERDALVSVLQVIYRKFYMHRKFIRKSVFNVFYCNVNEKHNGISDLLLLLSSIVAEEHDLGVQEEFKLFLVRGLIPLYKSKRLVFFSSRLNSCIEKFVETDCKLADFVIQGMLKHWPIPGGSREYFFLDGVERVVRKTKPDDFQHFMIPLFHRIASCLSSPHYMVAEKGLSLFKVRGNVQSLIIQNLDVILPIIFTDLETNARNHWRPEIQKLAHEVGTTLLIIDIDLFEQCRMHLNR